MNSTKKVIFIMGVSGSGKSTIGKRLSEALMIPFFDGDDYHPQSNINKMASGEPLNDNDRQGWLESLNELAKSQLQKQSCVIVCSALKQKYRESLKQDIETQVRFVYLAGSYDKILERLNSREDHFMSSKLLKSQFDALEEPEDAIEVDINQSPDDIIKNLKKQFLETAEFGVLGLGVMGKSLCLNLANKGFKIAMYNRYVEGIEVKVAEKFKRQHHELSNALGFEDVASFVNSLERPRRIMLMVNAGKAVDMVIENLIPFLSVNDIIIDGGNSNYKKTKNRQEFLKTKGIHFIGTGISGGEQGALKGPSIMPGGNAEAYKMVKNVIETIAAKDINGKPCCTYIGPEGSGHFVKMVHNGIEYVEMQLLAEVSRVLEAMGQSASDISNTFEQWKKVADSYLLDITAKIFRKQEGSDWLVYKILDKAGNKGTGNWATIASAELGVPSTLISSALFSRYISFYKEERLMLNKKYPKSRLTALKISTDELLKAYQFARIINHYQGFKLMAEASKKFNWNLNLSEIARIWTNGCIIKSTFMQELVLLLKETNNVLTNPKIILSLNDYKGPTRQVVSQCIKHDITIPALSEALQFFNGITTKYTSANVIQAQRDFFGAHTYQRLDDETGANYHTEWE